MKTMFSFVLITLLGLVFASCNAATPADDTALPDSMKGYELYSWQENNQWHFSLLVGTNREKTLDEIKSAGTILPDMDALLSTLKKVPSGQYVTWSTRETLSLPPEEIIQQVEQVCQEQGLILSIAR
jgi:hypothetical protein